MTPGNEFKFYVERMPSQFFLFPRWGVYYGFKYSALWVEKYLFKSDADKCAERLNHIHEELNRRLIRVVDRDGTSEWFDNVS